MENVLVNRQKQTQTEVLFLTTIFAFRKGYFSFHHSKVWQKPLLRFMFEQCKNSLNVF